MLKFSNEPTSNRTVCYLCCYEYIRGLISPEEIYKSHAPLLIVLNNPSGMFQSSGELAQYIARVLSASRNSQSILYVLEDSQCASMSVLKYYSNITLLQGKYGMVLEIVGYDRNFALLDSNNILISRVTIQPNGHVVQI